MSPLVVFDTNVVLSALLFANGQVAWLRDSWRCRECVPLVSADTTRELMRVLTYPKFDLGADEIEALLGDYLPYAQTLKQAVPDQPTPTCRDPHDQIFLDLAFAGGAKVLVTGDQDLLVLDRECPFSILSPGDFARMLRREH